MTTLRATVAAAGGTVRPVRATELWWAATLLADTLPLDRPATYPRALRRLGHAVRLALWDRALTGPDRTAVLVVGHTPWLAAGAAAVGAAALVPRSAVWQRRLLLALAAGLVLRRRRIMEELALRRRLRELAPGGLLVADLVSESPHAAVPWIRTVVATLDANRHDGTLVAILPGARRDAARERIYTRMLGFEVAGHARSGGRTLTLLVRRPGHP